MSDRIFDKALALAAHGLPVFPVREDKKPACPHGFKDATCDGKSVKQLFTKYPASLIGVPTGALSGLDVLDIDPRHGGDKWLAEHGTKIPKTRVHGTRSGGWHYLFKHHDGLKNSAGRVAAGVDIRADGGYSQALALDSIFASLARRAQLNMGEYLDAADRYMRLALKAQGQCRATLETLAAIKNPPVVFAKQANIANGPQQVNNTVNKSDGGFYSNTHARAGNSDSVQNELLEDQHEQGMDIGTTGATGRGDPAMATMDAIHRPTHE